MPFALTALLGSILGLASYNLIFNVGAPLAQKHVDWGIIPYYVGRVKNIDQKSRVITIDAESEFPDLTTVPVQFIYDRKTDFFYTINDARDDTLYGQKGARTDSNIIHTGARVAVQKSNSTPTGLYAPQITILTP